LLHELNPYLFCTAHNGKDKTLQSLLPLETGLGRKDSLLLISSSLSSLVFIFHGSDCYGYGNPMDTCSELQLRTTNVVPISLIFTLLKRFLFRLSITCDTTQNNRSASRSSAAAAQHYNQKALRLFFYSLDIIKISSKIFNCGSLLIISRHHFVAVFIELDCCQADEKHHA
jgi:hypothetical protein